MSDNRQESLSYYKGAAELVKQAFDELTIRYEQGSWMTGVSSGYTSLDRLTIGFQPSNLIIVGARPAMGKTAFALNIAMHAAIREGVGVLVYSLGESRQRVIFRMLCAWGKVDLSRLRCYLLTDDDWAHLHTAAGRISDAPLYIDDSPALSVAELRIRTRCLKAEKNIGLVIIDDIQSISSKLRYNISGELREMARELSIPVIALSQLNRNLEKRLDSQKRPRLTDLREFVALEADADLIMFIYRDSVYRVPELWHLPVDKTEIIIAKNRNGPIGMVNLMFTRAYSSFVSGEVP